MILRTKMLMTMMIFLLICLMTAKIVSLTTQEKHYRILASEENKNIEASDIHEGNYIYFLYVYK